MPRELTFDVPEGLSEVLFGVWSLQPCSPDVLDGVPEVEAHVLGYIDALNPARVGRIVGRMVDIVCHRITVGSEAMKSGMRSAKTSG